MAISSKVEIAQTRANISAYLSNNPGSHSTTTIAGAISQPPRTTGQVLGGMSRGGLIKFTGKKGKEKTWRWLAAPESKGDHEHMPPVKRAPAPASNPAKEIELSIAGLQIIVGRNPATGRLRIILEET